MFASLRLKQAFDLGGLSVRELAIRTWKKIGENEIMTRASAVSFYAMLAFIPFLGLVISLAVQLLPDLTGASGKEGMGSLTVEKFKATLGEVFPDEANQVVQDQIVRMQEAPPVGLLSIGLIITLWSASSLFAAIMDALNRVYGVDEARPFVKKRLTAILMTVIQATILIGSFLTIVLWPQVLGWFGLGTGGSAVATAIQILVVFLMILLSFAMTLYVAPNSDQSWEWISPGSVVGAAVLLGVSYLFRIYVQNFGSYNETYGSLGGVMALLFWFWISFLVLLSAGQINKVIKDAAQTDDSRARDAEAAGEPSDSDPIST